MSPETLRVCVIAAADAVELARDELCRLDAVAGDGDHGVTMALAARAVRQKLAENPDAHGAELLTTIGLAMGSVGGAIGPIYATALHHAASAVRALDAQPGDVTVDQLRACAEAAAFGVTSLGHAKPGDKTIVDAIAPSVAALGRSTTAGDGMAAAVRAAVAAASAGAESTTDMIATLGRASRLGERSRGSPDPGARSLVVIVDALVRAYLAEADNSGVGVET